MRRTLNKATIRAGLMLGAVGWLGDLPVIHMSFFGFMDWLFGNVMLAVGAVFISFFFGWIWNRAASAAEIGEGFRSYPRYAPAVIFLLKFFCPAAIAVVLFFLFKELVAGG